MPKVGKEGERKAGVFEITLNLRCTCTICCAWKNLDHRVIWLYQTDEAVFIRCRGAVFQVGPNWSTDHVNIGIGGIGMYGSHKTKAETRQVRQSRFGPVLFRLR
jgi:hypothetical protein